MGLSQSRFARYFNIPVSTIQNWEQGSRTPPPYVVEMMFQIVGLENYVQDYLKTNTKGANNMGINFETVGFIAMLNELARKTSYGFANFEDCKEADEYKGIIYCSNDPNSGYNDVEKNVDGYCVVADMLGDENNRYVTEIYGATNDSYAVRVLEDGLGEKFVAVYIRNEYGKFEGDIVIEDGVWYYNI